MQMVNQFNHCPEYFQSPAEPGGVLLARRTVVTSGLAVAVALGAGLELGGCSSGPKDKEPGPPVQANVKMGRHEAEPGQEVDMLAFTWGYLPGVTHEPGSIRLRPVPLAVRDKRAEDKPYRPYIPVNTCGPHLEVSGNFAIKTETTSRAQPVVELHAQLPTRFDDFVLYRGPRLQYQLKGDSLAVSVFPAGRPEKPQAAFNFAVPHLLPNQQVDVQCLSDTILFVVNGKQVGSMPRAGLFDSGQVWLGMGSDDDVVLKKIAARPLDRKPLSIIDTSSMQVAPISDPLAGHAKTPGFPKKGFDIGSTITPDVFADPQDAEVVLGGDYTIVTPENAYKMQDIQPDEGVFNFGPADAEVAIAARHGVAIRGHTLLYSKAFPRWVNELPTQTDADKQRLREVLDTHVNAVVARYVGRVKIWDVANEVIAGFNDQANFESGGDNVFFAGLGPKECLAIAFRAARRADPNAVLCINDYGMETNPQGRGEFMYNLVKELLEQGVPVDAIGIQGHVYKEPRDHIDPKKLSALIARFRSLGVEVHITELDVTGAGGNIAQGNEYAGVVRTAVQSPGCTNVTTWGASDKYGSTAGDDGRPGNALPYTADYRPKPAIDEMRKVLQQAA